MGRKGRAAAREVVYVERKRRPSGCFWLMLILGLIFVFPLMLLDEMDDLDESGRETGNPQGGQSRMQRTIDGLEIADEIEIDAEWWKSGSVMLANVELRNPTVHRIKDITFRASVYGESGTRVDRKEHTATIMMGPGECRSLSEINLGFIPQQAEKAAWKVLTCVLVEDASAAE